MLRAALGTASLSAVTNLNRNCKPTCTHFTADWNIPHVRRRAFFCLYFNPFNQVIFIRFDSILCFHIGFDSLHSVVKIGWFND